MSKPNSDLVSKDGMRFGEYPVMVVGRHDSRIVSKDYGEPKPITLTVTKRLG
jgi:hypothetical protein